MEDNKLLKQPDKEAFEGALNHWYDKWKIFLIERTINEGTGKSYYTQKGLEVLTEA